MGGGIQSISILSVSSTKKAPIGRSYYYSYFKDETEILGFNGVLVQVIKKLCCWDQNPCLIQNLDFLLTTQVIYFIFTYFLFGRATKASFPGGARGKELVLPLQET